MQSIMQCSKIQKKKIKHNYAGKGCLHHPDIKREKGTPLWWTSQANLWALRIRK